jgi:hypothetical protein
MVRLQFNHFCDFLNGFIYYFNYFLPRGVTDNIHSKDFMSPSSKKDSKPVHFPERTLSTRFSHHMHLHCPDNDKTRTPEHFAASTK